MRHPSGGSRGELEAQGHLGSGGWGWGRVPSVQWWSLHPTGRRGRAGRRHRPNVHAKATAATVATSPSPPEVLLALLGHSISPFTGFSLSPQGNQRPFSEPTEVSACHHQALTCEGPTQLRHGGVTGLRSARTPGAQPRGLTGVRGGPSGHRQVPCPSMAHGPGPAENRGCSPRPMLSLRQPWWQARVH